MVFFFNLNLHGDPTNPLIALTNTPHQIHHKLFQRGIILTIILNTAFLAMDSPFISADLQRILNAGNLLFFGIFFLEMIMKVLV